MCNTLLDKNNNKYTRNKFLNFATVTVIRKMRQDALSWSDISLQMQTAEIINITSLLACIIEIYSIIFTIVRLGSNVMEKNCI